MAIAEKLHGFFSGNRRKSESVRPTYEEWLHGLVNIVLTGIKDDQDKPAFFEGAAVQDCTADDLRRLGSAVLEGDVHIEIAQVCDGINNVGGAENPRIRITPRGVPRLAYRNIIFGDGYPDEEPFAQSFTLLDNPVDGQDRGPNNPILDGVLKADSVWGIGTGIGPIH